MAFRKMTCPECQKVLRPAKPVPEGKKVRCPECDSVFYPEDAINPVEAAEEGDDPRARPKNAAPAKKATGGAPPAKKSNEESETYGYVKEDDDDDDKPRISYAPDTSIKDLRGPAQAILMGPSNKLAIAGLIGVGGWMVLLILLLIPALFPLKPDETKKRPVMRIKPGLSHASPSGPSGTGGGGGGFPGGFPGGAPGGAPPGGGGQSKTKMEEEKPGFYDIYGIDVAFITDYIWWLFLLALIPLLLCMCWSGAVAYGAIKMQNMESRAWGIASSILAMAPINAGGLILVTALVVQIVLIQVIDDVEFIGYVVMVLAGKIYILSLTAGIMALVTLMKKEVIAGFEYVAE